MIMSIIEVLSSFSGMALPEGNTVQRQGRTLFFPFPTFFGVQDASMKAAFHFYVIETVN